MARRPPVRRGRPANGPGRRRLTARGGRPTRTSPPAGPGSRRSSPAGPGRTSAGRSVRRRGPRVGRERTSAPGTASPVIFRNAGRTNNSNPTNELTGLPGRPKTKVARRGVPNRSGFPGLSRTLWKWAVTPRSFNTSGHQVELARRDAAGQHEHVSRVEPAGHEPAKALALVGGDAQVLDDGPGPARQGPEHRPVAVPDLPRPRPLNGFNQLVPCRQDREPGGPVNPNVVGPPHRGEKPDRLRRERGAGRDDDLARPHLPAAGRIDSPAVTARRRRTWFPPPRFPRAEQRRRPRRESGHPS